MFAVRVSLNNHPCSLTGAIISIRKYRAKFAANYTEISMRATIIIDWMAQIHYSTQIGRVSDKYMDLGYPNDWLWTSPTT